MIADYDSPTAKLESGRLYHVLHDQPIDIRDSASKSVWQAIVAPYGTVQLAEPTDFPIVKFPCRFELWTPVWFD